MNKKTIIAVLLIVLLAAVSILGLPLAVRSVEYRTEKAAPTVIVTPEPFQEDCDEESEWYDEEAGF